MIFKKNDKNKRLYFLGESSCMFWRIHQSFVQKDLYILFESLHRKIIYTVNVKIVSLKVVVEVSLQFIKYKYQIQILYLYQLHYCAWSRLQCLEGKNKCIHFGLWSYCDKTWKYVSSYNIAFDQLPTNGKREIDSGRHPKKQGFILPPIPINKYYWIRNKTPILIISIGSSFLYKESSEVTKSFCSLPELLCNVYEFHSYQHIWLFAPFNC